MEPKSAPNPGLRQRLASVSWRDFLVTAVPVAVVLVVVGIGLGLGLALTVGGSQSHALTQITDRTTASG